MRQDIIGPELRDDMIDIWDIAAVLWRRRLVLLAAMLGTAGVTFGLVRMVVTPTYSARAELVVDQRQSSMLELGSVLSAFAGGDSAINTEMEVIMSTELLGQVAKTLDLARDPDFNPALVVPGPIARWMAGGHRDDQTPEQVEAVVLERLALAVTVSNPVDTFVLHIDATSPDPARAAEIANAVAGTYIEDQVGYKVAATDRAAAWLGEKVADLRRELVQGEQALSRFSAEIGALSPETLAATEAQGKLLRDRISETRTAVDELVRLILALRALTGPGDLSAFPTDTALARQTFARLSALDARAFDIARDATLGQLDLRRDTLIEQLANLIESSAALDRDYGQRSAEMIELQQRTREVEATRQLYEYFLSRLKETSVQSGMFQPDARILSAAIADPDPTKPNLVGASAGAGIVGLLLAALASLVLEGRSKVFRSVEELSAGTRRVVLGQVPLVRQARRGGLLDYMAANPTSAYVESIRNLRTSVLMQSEGRPPQVILVSSALPGEGKSTVSFALAQNLAGMGKKVLLVEGDMRRRIFAEFFDLAGHDIGLRAAIDTPEARERSITTVGRFGFDVLPSETDEASPADLLSSDGLGRLLDRLRSDYDHVIVDCPPVLVVPDARIMARLVDAILVVVRWDATKAGQVAGVIDAFESVRGAPEPGLVLNQCDPAGMRRYGMADSYGAYGTYGSQYYRAS
ncbi:polysaccharide biosynthesis tyrosine autokinase [Maritimibacter sp. DP1N21-5]|uniref:GumC family protein n=1 Tax=Maritimibacter sp. DP1N21-5 TaxID=2836867 RepID=UPI001C459B81|nr:polysaccharide biosynthesis tyrosine autokinase [Maritimibacter sp. DP1N21-5]MBV7407495.1 AAA family ATPase [Maritimibacter sp. DP1N21-5]